jgi:hypothetical protein
MAAQLLISLFPHEFLPEILGFNLHYELLTMDTLKAARELPEFGISGYYFALHISIDNSDSGHTAMALETVVRYLEIIREQDPAMVLGVWKRVQAGYVLSSTSNEKSPLLDTDRHVADLLRLKANASHKIHCPSRVKIDGQPLAQWLSPEHWTQSDRSRKKCLTSLSNAKPWVVRGKSEKSLLMRELSWNGRMFGAFTNKEVGDVQAWIDNLDCEATDYETRYWSEVGRSKYDKTAFSGQSIEQNITTQHPVFLPQPKLQGVALEADLATCDLARLLHPGIINITKASIDTIIVLWFAHPCLLENVISTPYRTATPLASHVLRILRAESGFLEEGLGVDGKDEQHRLHEGHSLVSLGLEMNQRLGRSLPATLNDVLHISTPDTCRAISFSKDMLAFALRPIQNETLLLGLALAFLDLETAVAQHDSLLSMESRQALQYIVSRKRTAFQNCFITLEKNQNKYRDALHYCLIGRAHIANLICSGGL